MDRITQIKNSFIWSAYGDALGFITELADKKRVSYRTGIGEGRVDKTLKWTRTIGGRFGARVDLPAGMYSDDTQLRLATSRCIRGSGNFDVEAFAKIELPVWLGYSLGAGTGTKAAASNFRNPNVNWFSNFFSTQKRKYTECGGNGAAMRIQPHIWATYDLKKKEKFLLDVFRNAICTHGHPRGFVGALFHALSLARSIVSLKIPTIKDWKSMLDDIPRILPMIRDDNELGNFWLPGFEERYGDKIDKVFLETLNELNEYILKIEDLLNDKEDLNYDTLVEHLEATKKNIRGSGLLTPLLANALCLLNEDKDPNDILRIGINSLGTDTDTIATMAGAMLGAVDKRKPAGDLIDKEYISDEAERLYNISMQMEAKSFDYPDLQKWQSPQANVDIVRKYEGRIVLVGLGFIDYEREKFESKSNKDFYWQILITNFGQTVIAKRRKELDMINGNQLPLVKLDAVGKRKSLDKKNRPNIDTIINELTNEELSRNMIGKHILIILMNDEYHIDMLRYAEVLRRIIANYK